MGQIISIIKASPREAEVESSGELFHATESGLLPVVLESYLEAKNTIADLEKKHQILAAENIQLQEKAARELSGAWLINRLVIGSIAALTLIQAGRLISARDWLLDNIEGVHIDIPNYQSDSQLSDWANTHQTGQLNHAQALEIIKQQMPATTQIINEIMAQGVDGLVANIEDQQMHYEEND
ncbi:hypothetical protein [Yersinia sp. Marseille-Q3913]|uniref:hypothetical protein n=1 Tax=Yersinia sp. Marseille-Q3913 TaxID=2830769 RepID=UPI001BAE99A7|nr:hypothetical protein [Yersinia sp. Marseille-Q3913]MBS0056916.1 hypothetical protein [Yersinia sp. Marseille-Q3913]